jgi:hypothetical protein
VDDVKWRLRRFRRRLYDRVWPVRETCTRMTLNGEPYAGRVSVRMRLNGPTTMEPLLAGEFMMFSVATRYLFGRWRPREVGTLRLCLVDGKDPSAILETMALVR